MIFIEQLKPGDVPSSRDLEAGVRYRAEINRGVMPAALDEIGNLSGASHDDELAPSELMTPVEEIEQPITPSQLVFDLGAIQARRNLQMAQAPSTIRYGHDGTARTWGEQ